MSDLANQQCKREVTLLSQKEISTRLGQIASDWSVSNNSRAIGRSFKFKNYYETMAFVNVIAMVAHQQDHHPDMTVRYNTCRVDYSTHSVGGLSNNDFICAAKIDRLLNI